MKHKLPAALVVIAVGTFLLAGQYYGAKSGRQQAYSIAITTQ
ncbi:hypothetical protein [Pseudomonas sp.]|nr:hypothetical protein [Pseudomonas sp.]MDP2746208.1 hypothetical protein [Pseudomonas sp.]